MFDSIVQYQLLALSVGFTVIQEIVLGHKTQELKCFTLGFVFVLNIGRCISASSYKFCSISTTDCSSHGFAALNLQIFVHLMLPNTKNSAFHKSVLLVQQYTPNITPFYQIHRFRVKKMRKDIQIMLVIISHSTLESYVTTIRIFQLFIRMIYFTSSVNILCPAAAVNFSEICQHNVVLLKAEMKLR